MLLSFYCFDLPLSMQVILDITFYEENKLVDQEFPEECSPFKIQELLQDLTEPEVLSGRLAPAQEVMAATRPQPACWNDSGLGGLVLV